MTTYVHYGHRYFDANLFEPIQNTRVFTKPTGGIWASRTDAKFGWKDWCKDTDGFFVCDDDFSFVFSLKEDAKILEVHSHKDFLCIYEKYGRKEVLFPTCFQLLDFELLHKDYDAIEYFLSDDRRLYHDMYGWDCDSILIMNPEIIQEKGN